MTEQLFFLAQGQKGGGFESLIFMVIMFVIMWVVLIRPQSKRRKEQQAKVSAMKKGDKVVSIGGIHGEVNAINDSKNTVSVKVSDGVFLTFDKNAIGNVISKDAPAEEKK